MSIIKISEVEYQSIHVWLRKEYGNATHCENDITHKAKSYQWANISGKYKKERNDFKMLCPPCHKKMDFGNYCKKGHPLFGDNCHIALNKRRVCKTCRTIYRRERYWKVDSKTKTRINSPRKNVKVIA